MLATLLIALGIGVTSTTAIGSCLLCALRRRDPSEPKPTEQPTEETSLLGSNIATENTSISMASEQPDFLIKVTPHDMLFISPSEDIIKPLAISPKNPANPPLEETVEISHYLALEMPRDSSALLTGGYSDAQGELETDIPEFQSLYTVSSTTVTPGLFSELAQNGSPPAPPIQVKSDPIPATQLSRRNSQVRSKRKGKNKVKGRGKEINKRQI